MGALLTEAGLHGRSRPPRLGHRRMAHRRPGPTAAATGLGTGDLACCRSSCRRPRCLARSPSGCGAVTAPTSLPRRRHSAPRRPNVHRSLAEAAGTATGRCQEAGASRQRWRSRIRVGLGAGRRAVGPLDEAAAASCSTGCDQAPSARAAADPRRPTTWARCCRFPAGGRPALGHPGLRGRAAAADVANATSPTCRCATSSACCAPSTTPRAAARLAGSPTTRRLPPPTSGWTTAPTAFLAGYAEVSPANRRPRVTLFVALWLDKALYEVVYEHGTGRDWVTIPVERIRRRWLRWQYRLRQLPAAPSRSRQRQGISHDRPARSGSTSAAPAAPRLVATETHPVPVAGGAARRRNAYHAPHSVLGAHLDDHGHVTIRTVEAPGRVRHRGDRRRCACP